MLIRNIRLKATALVLGLGVIIAAACAETTAPVPQPELRAVQADSAQLLELLQTILKKTLYLQCSALPTASDTEWVGPAGGTLHIGPHKLVIPAGALDSLTRITATAPSGTMNRIEFQPHGLTFDREAKLTMSYANCGLVGGLLPRHIVYANDELRPLEFLDAVPNLLRRETTAKLDHFSDYVLAW